MVYVETPWPSIATSDLYSDGNSIMSMKLTVRQITQSGRTTIQELTKESVKAGNVELFRYDSEMSSVQLRSVAIQRPHY